MSALGQAMEHTLHKPAHTGTLVARVGNPSGAFGTVSYTNCLEEGEVRSGQALMPGPGWGGRGVAGR